MRAVRPLETDPHLIVSIAQKFAVDYDGDCIAGRDLVKTGRWAIVRVSYFFPVHRSPNKKELEFERVE